MRAQRREIELPGVDEGAVSWKLADETRLVIQANDAATAADKPLVVLLPPAQGGVLNFFDVSNTTLELKNLHLALDAAGFASDPDDALLHVQGGDLFVANCSFTVRGASAAA